MKRRSFLKGLLFSAMAPIAIALSVSRIKVERIEELFTGMAILSKFKFYVNSKTLKAIKEDLPGIDKVVTIVECNELPISSQTELFSSKDYFNIH